MANLKKTYNKTGDGIILFFIFSLAVLLKYLIYGFNYFPVLDDYIQYGCYPQYKDTFHVLFGIGTVKTRPLASLLDIVFWGRLWSYPKIILLIITLLHSASGIVFYKIFEKNNIKATPVFLIIYLLFPLGFEGAYWLSAATRIVVGLFFASLGLYFLTAYLKDGGKIKIFASVIFLALSCGFYEAVSVFAFITATIIILYRKNKKGIFPFIAITILLATSFLYPILAKNIGAMGTRADSINIVKSINATGDMFSQVFENMKNGITKITIGGFYEGIKILLITGILGIIVCGAVFAVSILIGIYSVRSVEKLSADTRKNIIIIIIGIILFFAPITPNILSLPIWITYRTMLVSIIGLAVICDRIIILAKSKGLTFVLAGALTFIFIISGINEYDTYKRTYESDNALLSKITNELTDDVLSGRQNVVVLLDDIPNVAQINLCKDHVKTVFYTDWSLTGAVRFKTENLSIKLVTPVFPDTDYKITDELVIDMRKNRENRTR